MKRNTTTLQEIKEKISSLQGKSVNVISNRGRNKIEKCEGKVENIYQAVFTIRVDGAYKTFSYSDILCGSVKVESL